MKWAALAWASQLVGRGGERFKNSGPLDDPEHNFDSVLVIIGFAAAVRRRLPFTSRFEFSYKQWLHIVHRHAIPSSPFLPRVRPKNDGRYCWRDR